MALRAAAFVRSYEEGRQAVSLPQTQAGEPIRILLVICRPKGDKDVPFRSVASRLVKGLKAEASQQVQLDVLRPPTFEQLGKVLQAAQRAGKPYHVLHFDGHGAYLELATADQEAEALAEQLASLLDGVSADFFKARRRGKHGYLLFENPQKKQNMQLVDGRALGQLLVKSNVDVLVLNACRSAHAEPDGESDKDQAVSASDENLAPSPTRPLAPSPTRPLAPSPTRPLAPSPPRPLAPSQAYGSLAQEVMEQGVAGVVAMRYNLYVVTATRLVAELYEGLVKGYSLGAAVTHSRQQLALSPTRQVAYGPIDLQDWSVPVVYEAAPIKLLPSQGRGGEEARGRGGASLWAINLSAASTAAQTDTYLPSVPDAGFFGRDETLLALDRAFDEQSIVLLHAYAGSGKTTTAAEFARWYQQTGGIERVLFTSFEQYQPLARVLDKIGRLFEPILQQNGIQWLALSDAERRDVALQLLRLFPVLWIWDNVELVAGFPTGTPSKWTAQEQQELADFLRVARGGAAKFLLTSRRDEQSWLSGLPRRIKVPPMRRQDRVELAQALASKHGRRLTHADWQAWLPLLFFTQGNPLTLTVVVGQALREKLQSKAEIKAYVAQLRAGKASFTDDKTQGRSKSLGASLSYGFEHTFSQPERLKLALLHFFQGFVDVDVLQLMGNPKRDWHLPTVRNLTRQSAINLLNRAAEIGLLTALGGGYYRIHPALPWFFKSLFDQYYEHDSQSQTNDSSRPLAPSPSPPLAATRAFVEAMGELGNHYDRQYNRGNRNVIANLSAEEANLLHARQLARSHGWYWRIISTMQGLRKLYDQTGRRTEWERLVTEIVPDFVEPTSDGPLPGREEQWGLVNDYRVGLAQERRQWEDAERLQHTRVEWDRQRAAPALQAAQPDSSQGHSIRTLAVSLAQLGHIQREQGQATCAASYEEAISFYQRIGDQAAEAITAFNLGHAYYQIGALRDLAQAEQWYQRSYELFAEGDSRRVRCLGQLGLVAKQRFEEARSAQQPAAEQLEHLNAALNFYQQALALFPTNAVNDLAVIHNQLGNIYNDAGDLDRSLPHYREAIRYKEGTGDFYRAAQIRFNVAVTLKRRGRLQDARAFAQAALRDFQRYGAGAADKVQKTQRLLARIEEAMR